MTPRLIARPQDLRAERIAPIVRCMSSGDAQGAHAALLELVARHPEDSVATELLGILAYDSGRFDEAVRLLGRASTLAAGSSAYSYNEASALLLAGHPSEAVSAYLRSLREDEILVDAHRWAWSALSASGQLDAALKRLRAQLRRETAHIPSSALDPVALETVTLCIVDCVDPQLAVRSLRRSMASVRFGAVKLLTSHACRFDGIETVAINAISSKEEYSRFVMRELVAFVDTEYTLVTQWDGYVVNPAAWSARFLEFDYVGATWDEDLLRSWGGSERHNVGNGGFSLRSKRFMNAGRDPRIVMTHAEDAHLCRTYRPMLESDFGIRFADAATANTFSFEANVQATTPFGFHGAFNLSIYEPDPRWIRFEFLNDGKQ
jgi:hypothetical protein